LILSLLSRFVFLHVSGLQYKGGVFTNLFSRKSQGNKCLVSSYVDMQHLCFWHWHVLWLLLTTSRYFAVM